MTYILKEKYREFSLTTNHENCDEEFNDLIDEFLNSKFPEFRSFGSLLLHRKNELKTPS